MNRELTLKEAEKIVDDMYQKRWVECGIEDGNTIHMGNLDKLQYTELESASILLLRTEIILQQENKELKEENEFLKSEIEEAKRIIQKYLEYIDERDERIDKTIKYIESNNETLYTYEPDYDYEENMVDNYDISNYREDLLKILKGVE